VEGPEAYGITAGVSTLLETMVFGGLRHSITLTSVWKTKTETFTIPMSIILLDTLKMVLQFVALRIQDSLFLLP
jgi:hypothetical protein